jgi:tetratricopeptide (TPR) repeat protein
LYQQQGLTIEAKAQYQAVVDQFMKAGQVKKALEVYPKMLSVEPDNLKGRLQYADLLARSAAPAEAAREYRFVAQELAKKGLFDEAIQVAKKGAKAVPGNADLMSLLMSLTKEAQKSPGDLLASVEQMAKSTGDNPRSLALLGEAYLAAGKKAEADKLFRRLQAMADGAPPEVPAAVARYHASRSDASQAFEWMARAADDCAAADRPADAVNLMAELVRAFPDHRAGFAKLASLAEAAGDRKAQVEALERLAELHVEAGEKDEAAEIAGRLKSLDPENPKHAKLLASLQGGAAAAPAARPAPPAAASRPAPAAARPAPAPARPAVPDIQEGALDLEESPAVTIGADDDEAAAAEIEDEEPARDEEPAEVAEEDDADEAYGPDSKIQEMHATDEEGEEEDEDFINEHFTEAEVFVKYGLLEKAKEQLQKVLARYPRHAPSHTKLKEIYYEEGDKDRAVAECLTLAEIQRARGRRNEAQELVNEAIRIDPNNARVKEFQGAAAGARGKAAAAAPARGAAPRSAPAPARPAPPAPAPAPARPAPPAPPARPAAAPPARPAARTPARPEPVLEEEPELEIVDESAAATPEVSAGGDGDLEIEIDVPDEPAAPPLPPARPAPAAASPAGRAAASVPAAARPIPEKVEEETPEDYMGGLLSDASGGEMAIEIGGAGAGSAPDAAPQAFAGPARDPDAEKLGEVDFYIDQGLFEEARAVLFQLQKQYPGSQEVTRRFERANRATAEPPAARPAPARSEPSALDLDVERAFGSQTISMPVAGPVPRATKATPVFKVEKTAAAEPEGDFFDLAGELDRSLADAQVAVQTAEPEPHDGPGHSLDEIFKAFRKGVEQQVDSEDYETHYNLGIAYKEMGLVDEAIGEFQYAAKDPARTVECCGILGLCFREKGMHALALKWYQKGLDMPGLGEHEAIGLRYDMAEVHREQGDAARALQLYTEVYGIDSTYRDVTVKIKEMKKLLG